ncbi:MAG: hypothetical protein DMD86_16895 [Candidatus Rokuibacteriota bacterium]|nr:MAG: hypothetical protein DMD86_16895 [Candidatus Rokubacteria bacterium]
MRAIAVSGRAPWTTAARLEAPRQRVDHGRGGGRLAEAGQERAPAHAPRLVKDLAKGAETELDLPVSPHVVSSSRDRRSSAVLGSHATRMAGTPAPRKRSRASDSRL